MRREEHRTRKSWHDTMRFNGERETLGSNLTLRDTPKVGVISSLRLSRFVIAGGKRTVRWQTIVLCGKAALIFPAYACAKVNPPPSVKSEELSLDISRGQGRSMMPRGWRTRATFSVTILSPPRCCALDISRPVIRKR